VRVKGRAAGSGTARSCLDVARCFDARECVGGGTGRGPAGGGKPGILGGCRLNVQHISMLEMHSGAGAGADATVWKQRSRHIEARLLSRVLLLKTHRVSKTAVRQPCERRHPRSTLRQLQYTRQQPWRWRAHWHIDNAYQGVRPPARRCGGCGGTSPELQQPDGRLRPAMRGSVYRLLLLLPPLPST
jgi:hypothetical protein